MKILRNISYFVAGCMLTTGPALGSGCALPNSIEVQGARLKDQYNKCTSAFLKDFTLEVNGSRVSPDSVSADAQCKVNAGAGRNARGFLRLHLNPPLTLAEGKQLDFTQPPKSSLGACEMAWTSVKDIFCSVKATHINTCNETFEKLKTFNRCIETGKAEDCERKHKEIAQLYESINNVSAGHLNESSKFLQRIVKVNSEVNKKYSSDAKVLLGMRSSDMSQQNYEGVSSEEGNRLTVGEYLQLLIGPPRLVGHGDLMREQSNAIKAAGTLAEALREEAARIEEQSKSFAKTFRDYRDDSKTKNNSPIRDVAQYSPVATAGAQILQRNPATSGLGGAVPLAAAVAAGAAIGSSRSAPGGQTTTSSPDSTIPVQARTVEGTSLPTDLESGKSTPTAATNANTILKLEPEKASADTQDTGVRFNIGSNKATEGNTLGASVANKSKASKATLANGSSTRSTLANNEPNPHGEELLKEFSGDLSNPKKESADFGAEVGSILGQMKNLFQMDSPTPASGAFPEGGPGVSASGDADNQTGFGIAESEATLSADNKSEETLDPQAANPFGSFSTNLFDRIRIRHQKCIARGMVQWPNKEVPQ